MKKLLCCFGTRPEFIKMYPLIQALSKKYDIKTLNTGQHIELLAGLLSYYNFVSDYTLDVMERGQSLNKLSAKILEQTDILVRDFDYVVVQGDTTTAAMVGLSAFNNRVQVIHLEAGLRSNNKDNPFPEEINRRMITQFSDINLCPTSDSYNNLGDCISKHNYIVGNTVIDMLRVTSNDSDILKTLNLPNEYVLVTCHRRENHENIEEICEAILEISKSYHVVLPVHMNPNVKCVIESKLSNNENITLTSSFEYYDMVTIIRNCKFVVTDSGGLQEEAPYFGKYVYVMRDFTEREESVKLGMSELVGNKKEKILGAIRSYKQPSNPISPYGDGFACEKIIEVLEKIL